MGCGETVRMYRALKLATQELIPISVGEPCDYCSRQVPQLRVGKAPPRFVDHNHDGGTNLLIDCGQRIGGNLLLREACLTTEAIAGLVLSDIKREGAVCSCKRTNTIRLSRALTRHRLSYGIHRDRLGVSVHMESPDPSKGTNSLTPIGLSRHHDESKS